MSNVENATFDMEIPCQIVQGVRTCVQKSSHAHAARHRADNSEGCVGCADSGCASCVGCVSCAGSVGCSLRLLRCRALLGLFQAVQAV